MGPHYLGKFRNNKTKLQDTADRLFKQRWQSKKLIRAYHCDHIPEKKFVRWWLPERLPDPMARKPRSVDAAEAPRSSDVSATSWARPTGTAKETESDGTKEALAPISSLMFAELERRLDVVVFRCCFASSIHAARQLVVHGKVTLNGLKENDPNARLNPGDMISVQPDAMTLLHPPESSSETPAPRRLKKDEDTLTLEELGDTSPPTGSKVANDAASTEDPTFVLPPYASPFIFIPPYLEVSFSTCSAVYVRHPTARPNYSEIASPYDADGEIVRFAWEWYMKHRPRIRGWKRDVRDRMEKGKSGWSGI
ncbi:mitochondrial 37S ribosomal protein nam9 [Tulasnella sp. 403]|nr:mitochondrial 37S ribosomal protein nam9 [Tulasnella sp. 403]